MGMFGLFDRWRIPTAPFGDTSVLGYTEPPMYYYCECDVEGVLKCEMHLHIIEHPTNTKFRVRCIPAIGRELSDTC